MLIGLAPEELAYALLQVASSNLQNGIVHREAIISIDPITGDQVQYSRGTQSDVMLALREALNWLEVNGLILPAPGTNGSNGFYVLGRRGKALIDRDKFDHFRKAAEFPKSLLHPSISDRVWISLARGELSEAVFTAFRTIEESVRIAGGFSNTDIGVPLMRKAFKPEDGPLTDQTQPIAEQEALMQLFAGAIGSYKNPHSHRTITINDPNEAQEMVMLASHLLRIIDSRVAKQNA